MLKVLIGGVCVFFLFFFLFVFWGWELGMCESVRTRNTLYEVGAAKSKIWHNAVERRKDENRERETKIVLLQNSSKM